MWLLLVTNVEKGQCPLVASRVFLPFHIFLNVTRKFYRNIRICNCICFVRWKQFITLEKSVTHCSNGSTFFFFNRITFSVCYTCNIVLCSAVLLLREFLLLLSPADCKSSLNSTSLKLQYACGYCYRRWIFIFYGPITRACYAPMLDSAHAWANCEPIFILCTSERVPGRDPMCLT